MIEKIISCISHGKGLISELLADHEEQIHKAFLEGDDDVSISINLSIREAPNAPGLLVSTGISFIEKRVKDSASEIVDDDQSKLPGFIPGKSRQKRFRPPITGAAEMAAKKLAEELKSSGTSVTVTPRKESKKEKEATTAKNPKKSSAKRTGKKVQPKQKKK